MNAKPAANFADSILPPDMPFSSKQPWRLTTSVGDLLVRPTGVEVASEQIVDPVYVKASIGSDDVTVKLPKDALALFCNRREPGLEWQAINAAIRPIVLECILQDFLSRLEKIWGVPVSVDEINSDFSSGYASNFACEITVDGLAVVAGFQVPRNWLDRLHLWQAALPATMPVGLTVPINIRRGSAVLSKAELWSLRIGDAIVLDVSDENTPVWAVTGERYLSEVCETENGFQLLSPLLSNPPNSMRHLMSTPSGQDHSFQVTEGAIKDIPIRLVFDAGRLEVPVSDLEGLNVGHIFNVGRHPSRTVDIIAHGRIIGQGEIVTVEGLTAVRVTAINC